MGLLSGLEGAAVADGSVLVLRVQQQPLLDPHCSGVCRDRHQVKAVVCGDLGVCL